MRSIEKEHLETTEPQDEQSMKTIEEEHMKTTEPQDEKSMKNIDQEHSETISTAEVLPSTSTQIQNRDLMPNKCYNNLSYGNHESE